MTHEGFTLWLTGLSGAGKTTIAQGAVARLRAAGAKVELLDGDTLRLNLSSGLGFSREDRDTNIRRIGFISELLSRNGVIAVVAAISPYRETRDEVKRKIGNFLEVFVDCDLATLIARDVKGLYKRALSGEIGGFTGISDPYEPPLQPDLVIRTDRESPEESIRRVWQELERRKLIQEVVPESTFKENI